MKTKERTRKSYKKPQLTQVKFQLEEAVLQPCKGFDNDPDGKSTKYCGHPGCSTTFGT